MKTLLLCCSQGCLGNSQVILCLVRQRAHDNQRMTLRGPASQAGSFLGSGTEHGDPKGDTALNSLTCHGQWLVCRGIDGSPPYTASSSPPYSIHSSLSLDHLQLGQNSIQLAERRRIEQLAPQVRVQEPCPLLLGSANRPDLEGLWKVVTASLMKTMAVRRGGQH